VSEIRGKGKEQNVEKEKKGKGGKWKKNGRGWMRRNEREEG